MCPGCKTLEISVEFFVWRFSTLTDGLHGILRREAIVSHVAAGAHDQVLPEAAA